MEAPKRNLLQKITYLIGLYFYYIKNYFKTLVEYKMDTWISVFSAMLIFGSSLIFLGVTMRKIPSFAGWNFQQILLIFAIATTGRGLTQVFLNMPYFLHGYIRRGQLDIMLIRPPGVLFQMISISQEFFGFGGVLSGLVVMIYASIQLGIIGSPAKICFLILSIICSTLIQFAILLIVATPGFWVLEARSIILPIGWLVDFARYPLEIYTPFLRCLLTYILPFAVGSFYPAAYLIAPAKYGWVLFTVPGVTVVLLFVSYRFWLFGLDHYSSAT